MRRISDHGYDIDSRSSDVTEKPLELEQRAPVYVRFGL